MVLPHHFSDSFFLQFQGGFACVCITICQALSNDKGDTVPDRTAHDSGPQAVDALGEVQIYSASAYASGNSNVVSLHVAVPITAGHLNGGL